MPFKSKAQYRKFRELLRKGKIKEKTFRKFRKETGDISKLPERVSDSKEKEKK